MLCPKCGSNNQDNASKCAKCGVPLGDPGATQSIPAQTQMHIPPQPHYPPPPPTQYQVPQQPYQPPPYPPQPGYAPQAYAANSISIIAIIFAVLSFGKILFGLVAIGLGVYAVTKRERLGVVAICVAVGFMFLGIALRALVLAAIFKTIQNMVPNMPH